MENQSEKPLSWVGDSKKRLMEFPANIRRDAGYALSHVQLGSVPPNWKPFEIAGPGTKEIILRDEDGWYRVVYVAKFEEAVYVLHAFQKKTNQTSKADVAAAESAYKAVVKHRGKK